MVISSAFTGLALVAMLCAGSEQQINSTGTRKGYFVEKIGIDLAASQWCDGPCNSMKPIQKITGSEVLLYEAQGPSGNPYAREALDISTGALEDTFLLDGFGFVRSGKCRPSNGQ
jgi:hypothetical protein